jgi:hypothetical protein
MKHRLKRKSEDWRRKLPRPLVVRGGKTLRLLSDCRSYVLDLDRDEAGLSKWQHAAELMLAAAKGGDLFEVVLQFERILIHKNKLVLGDEPAAKRAAPAVEEGG